LQQILIAEGVYPQALVTGYFGPLTQAALVLFQTKHNLPQTGVTSAPTQAKLNAVAATQARLAVPVNPIVLAADLSQGMSGAAVSLLQSFLVQADSYPEALVTGYFGPLTLQAVEIFQSTYNIQPVSGYVGPKTRHVMETISAQ
jgi:peptidoglycan hydrolase-like protein with peptidoglycan-binding domain